MTFEPQIATKIAVVEDKIGGKRLKLYATVARVVNLHQFGLFTVAEWLMQSLEVPVAKNA